MLDKIDQPTKTISRCFELLRYLSDGVQEIKQLLFDNIERLMNITTKYTGWENEMAKTLASLFVNNGKLSLLVRNKHIERIVELLVEHTNDAPDLPLLLRAIGKCEDLGVSLPRIQVRGRCRWRYPFFKINHFAFLDSHDPCLSSHPVFQSQIMSLLVRSFTAAGRIAFLDVVSDPDLNVKRLDLLRGSDEKLRRYHANLVGLFASCAEGELSPYCTPQDDERLSVSAVLLHATECLHSSTPSAQVTYPIFLQDSLVSWSRPASPSFRQKSFWRL